MRNYVDKVRKIVQKAALESQCGLIFPFLRKQARFELKNPLYPKRLLREIFIRAAEDDFVYPDIVLPDECFLTATAAEIEDAYRANWQLFEESLKWQKLKNLALCFGFGFYPPPDKKMQDFKDIRACGKNFRFACQSFDHRHSSPIPLRILLWVMGEVKDSVSYKCRGKAVFFSLLLWFLCISPIRFLLRFQAMDFRAENPQGLAEFHHRENNRLSQRIESDCLTAHEFHSLRKIISRRVFFADNLWVLSPKRNLAGLDRYLATLNGLMGARHDRLVFQSARGKMPYRQARLQFPVLCGYYLRHFLRACEKAD